MNNFWNERYATVDYVYGTKPNLFYKNELDKLKPGKILFPAEGEGRNAVYAAKKGWEVTAFDPSTEGKRKAEILAQENNVIIQYLTDNYDTVNFPKETFDCMALIFAHMHPAKRTEYHRKLASFLKPGGVLILEGFSKKQIHNNTGGPRDVNMLFSKEELEHDFSGFSQLAITEAETVLEERLFHQGKADVIRVVGIK